MFFLLKDTSTDIGLLCISIKGIKHEGIVIVNRLIKQVDSLKGGVQSSNTDFAVSVHTSYSNISTNVEQSYKILSDWINNSLKYLWGSNH